MAASSHGELPMVVMQFQIVIAETAGVNRGCKKTCVPAPRGYTWCWISVVESEGQRTYSNANDSY
jgi:hypothetical protein